MPAQPRASAASSLHRRIATALQNQAEDGDHPSRLHSQTRPESLPRLPSTWTLNSRPSSPLLWPYSTG